jgi:hypothetical protein
MVTCPNCRHDEIFGALFCSECGARLVAVDLPTTQNISHGSTESLTFQVRPKSPPVSVSAPEPAPAHAEATVSLHLVESGQILNLSGQSEYSIGRAAEGQFILPDVDLSNYQAYAQGVSRLHAALKINNQRIYITDLGSSNGTRVNGQKIVPNVDFPLNHGDVIALGKFKIQVLFRK